jgi:hypothetical protein
MDEDRSRLDSLGISNRNLDRKSRRLFWILGGFAAVLFLSGIFYTIFFYITLPKPSGTSGSGTGVTQVPMPVPPTALFPRSTGTDMAVTSVGTDLFSAEVSRIQGSKTGFDLVLTMTFTGAAVSPDGVSLILSGPPRWVDGKQGASEGTLDWDKNRLFRKGDVLGIPVHFSVPPRTTNFDLYVGFTGGAGAGGKRYFLHFSGLKLERSGG